MTSPYRVPVPEPLAAPKPRIPKSGERVWVDGIPLLAGTVLHANEDVALVELDYRGVLQLQTKRFVPIGLRKDLWTRFTNWISPLYRIFIRR